MDVLTPLPPAVPEKGHTVRPLLVTILISFVLTSYAVHLTSFRSIGFCAVYSLTSTWLMFRCGSWVRYHFVVRLPFALDPPWRRSVVMLSALFTCAVVFNLIDRFVLAGFYLRNEWLTPATIDRFLDGSLLVRVSAVLAVNGYFSAQLSYQRMTQSLVDQREALRSAAESRRLQLEAEADRNRAEMETRAARQLATEAELTALKMQMNPHFLFNTLGSIAVLARIDGPRAGQMTEKLAEIFRYALQASKQPTATLAEEIEFLEAYFEIERARFGSRLEMTIDVPNELLGAYVPNLLLQPMVENAVAHAFKDKCTNWRIALRASVRGDSLEISVIDNGQGFGGRIPTQCIGRGTALKNISERLQRLYGENGSLTVEENQPRGAIFKVLLPRSHTS